MRPLSRSMHAAPSTPGAHSEGSVVGVGWTVKQLLKIMALFGLIVAAMREADLDAKARARVALLAAIENESRRDRLAACSPESHRSTAAYLKACAECASGRVHSAVSRKASAHGRKGSMQGRMVPAAKRT